MEILFRVLETLCVGIIIGGGVIMATCVRPLLLPILSNSKNPELIATIEDISIKAWNKYNRYAFLASLCLLFLDGMRFFMAFPCSYWHAGIVSIIVLAFMKKFTIDRQLSIRLQTNSSNAVGSVAQNAGHRQVERLSKIILFLAVLAVMVSR